MNSRLIDMIYTKESPLRVFEAFAGYGSQALSLDQLHQLYPDFCYTVVGISEIDKYAIQAYMAIHGETTNYGDISKIDWDKVPDFDLFTYSFPCTDISSAGQQKGLEEGSETRSSLLWQCKRTIQAKHPKYLLMENVKNLVSRKFLPYFRKWEEYLRCEGYVTYWKVMNAKEYGGGMQGGPIPQNRERIFAVSIRIDDPDNVPEFVFPDSEELQMSLRDVLEENADESYYISDAKMKELMESVDPIKLAGRGFTYVRDYGQENNTSEC